MSVPTTPDEPRPQHDDPTAAPDPVRDAAPVAAPAPDDADAEVDPTERHGLVPPFPVAPGATQGTGTSGVVPPIRPA